MKMNERAIAYILVAILSLIIQQAAADTQAPSTKSPAPTINYVCDVNGNVNISTATIQSYQRIAVTGSGSGSNCKRDATKISGINEGQISLSDCKLKESIFVYLMNETLAEIYGGHGFHEYVIDCKLPTNGILLYATAKIAQAVTPKPSPETQTPPLSVVMTITPAANVIVGDVLTMEIHLDNTPPDKIGTLYILPESCKAMSGPNADGSGTTPAPLDLLVATSSVSLDHEIMKDFTIAKNGSAVTTVYAFRFMDSLIVTLQCKVHVCMDKSCSGTFQNYATSTTTSTKTIPTKKNNTITSTTLAGVSTAKRKRRAVEQRLPRPETHIVKAMFTVKEDERTTSGQASRGVCTISMIGLILIKPVLFLI